MAKESQFLPHNIWNNTNYASYTSSIAMFAMHDQPQLREIYSDKSKIKPLPFGIGYKYIPSISNMMIARRKSSSIIFLKT
ncbi:MAG: hypothetical protein N2167_11575 [Flavobacteriales bacterium]|nr:hypothetical protein [Flavobacteriales bacterium]